MKIVVVEDVPMVRERIVEALLDVPRVYVVGEAAGVESALSLIELNQPDVILLDISLPGFSSIKNGIGVLKWVKQTYPLMHVIMLTNHASLAYRQACETAGAFAFLDKSREFDQLSELIERLRDSCDHTVQTASFTRPVHYLGELGSSAYNGHSSLTWLHLLASIVRLIAGSSQREDRQEQPWQVN